MAQQLQRPGPNEPGPRQDYTGPGEDYAGGEGFDDQETRRNFIVIVYTILTVQLLVTAAIMCPFLFMESVQEFALRYWLLSIPFGITSSVIYFVLCCYDCARRNFPLNFILLAIFTICEGIVCGFISVRYSTEIILIAFVTTALICILVTIVAIFAPIDITGCGMVLYIMFLSLTFFSMIAMVIMVLFRVKFLYLIICGLFVMLFILYLLYDTQQIIGGRSVELEPDEYLLGAIQLYVDIIAIFQNLLPLIDALFGGDEDE